VASVAVAKAVAMREVVRAAATVAAATAEEGRVAAAAVAMREVVRASVVRAAGRAVAVTAKVRTPRRRKLT